MPEDKFVHLHNHSYYSLLDGLASPLTLVKEAKSQGFKSLAITDHGSCAGWLAFQKACLKEDIKPILGNEIYITEDMDVKEKGSKTFHLILLAKNHIGLKNLMHLSTLSETQGKYRKPRIDFNLLSKYHEGLICTSACAVGEISMKLWEGDNSAALQVAKNYKDLFGGDFYLEIMMHKYFSDKDQENREKSLAKKIFALGKKLDIKVIATNDVHYAKKQDAYYHDILLCMQTHDHIHNPKRFSFDSDEFYLKSYNEMEAMYSSAPCLLTNTLEIAEKIEGNKLLTFADELLPHFEIPSDYKSEEDYLKALVKDGMKKKGLINKPEYRERIRFEMNTILTCKYTRYFLVLWDVINYANISNIRIGIGRGSAVGCLCLYVLGVTKLDPLKYDLLFERFLNPERISPPDVDVDFDYDRRDEIYEYLYRKYGQDHCCKIGTYNTFKTRNVIRYAAKALDIGEDWKSYQKMKEKNPNGHIEMPKRTLDLADQIAKMVPEGQNIKVSIDSLAKDDENFKKTISKYPKLLETSSFIEGTVSSAGVHAAGIVVCKDSVDKYIPLRESKGQICSQFDGPQVEELGLLKFDILALKTLTVVEDTVRMVKERHGIDIQIDQLEPNDKKVFDLLNGKLKGIDNRGIFQFESDGMTKLLQSINVDSFEDMIVANALYRPGPLGAKVHVLYADYKHGRKPIDPLHPKMGELLKDTYGIMCFSKEQVAYTKQGPCKIKEIKNKTMWSFLDGKPKLTIQSIKSPISNGTKDVYKYILSNGQSLLCTENHPIMIEESIYMSAEQLLILGVDIPYPVGTIENTKTFINNNICAYLVGALVGKNSSKYNQSDEYAQYINELESLFNGGEVLEQQSLEIIEKIKKLDLHNQNEETRIPFTKIVETRETYLYLIAGVIDSSGEIGKSIKIHAKNSLLDDYQYVLWRLGYRTHLNSSENIVTVYRSKDLYDEIKEFLASNAVKVIVNIEECENVKIISKTFVAREEVYDLSIEDVSHNFFVSGVVAHNCYQENFMKISQELAGFTKGQSDTLRKAVGKKNDQLLAEQGEAFINGCVNNGISKDIAYKIFEQIKFFGGYGFNKSHSAAYAFLAYQTAYLKINYPIEFMTALLSSEINNNDKDKKLNSYMKQAYDMGLTTVRPNINKSGTKFTIENTWSKHHKKDIDVIRMPLTILKGIGAKGTECIIKNQPFSSLQEFIEKTDSKSVTSKVFSVLVQSRAITNEWGMTPDKLIENFEIVKQEVLKKQKEIKKQNEYRSQYGGSLFEMASNGEVKL